MARVKCERGIGIEVKFRTHVLTVLNNTGNRAQDDIRLLDHVLGQETQNEIAGLLEQQVLATVASIVLTGFEMEISVDLKSDLPRDTQEVDFHMGIRPKGDRQPSIEDEGTLGLRK